MNMKTWCVLIAAFVVLIGIGACSGGGGGSSSGGGSGTGTGTGLAVASKVSVVDPNLTGSVANSGQTLRGLKIGVFKITADQLSGTDFSADKTQVWVDDRTTDVLDNVNSILCMVGNTRYDAMVNKGAYLALVDQNLCRSASGAGQQSQDQSSGANMPQYMEFIMNSTRQDNTSDEIVKAWVHQPAKDQDPPAIIYAHIVVSEGTSSANPYGIFTLNFAGYALDDSGNKLNFPDGPTFNGTLLAKHEVASDPTSTVVLQFIQLENRTGNCNGTVSHETGSQAVTLDHPHDSSGGAGHVYSFQQSDVENCGGGTTNVDFAYDTSSFFRVDLNTAGTPSFCLNRNQFDESSWSYGLYDASGARVNRNSGFSINYSSGGKTYNGYIGYWGFWIDSSAPALVNGATVNKVDYNNGTSSSTPYQVFLADGKLKLHSRQTMTLDDIKEIPLSYWEQSLTTNGTGTNYQVIWDGSLFQKVSQMPQNCSGNCTWSDLPSQVPIDFTHLSYGGLNFWSDSLSGQVQVPLSNCTYSTSSSDYPNGYTSCDAPLHTDKVIFYAENLVYPGDTSVPTTLACYDNCLEAGTNGVDPNTNNGYLTMASTATLTSYATYTFDAAALKLYYGPYSVVSNTVSQSQSWGVMSGILFEPTDANLSLLACPAGNGWDSTQMCTWQAWSVLPAFYTWETGPNSYNRFVALRTGTTGTAFLKFQPPLQVQYTGLGGTNGKYGASGTKYILQYNGFGQLNGIPGKCVDLDSGLEADCAQSQNSQSIRWVPAFTIPSTTNGTDLTEVTGTDPADNTSASYYVKPLQVEQRMMAAGDPTVCNALETTDFGSYDLPNFTSTWADPVTAIGATEPSVGSAPAVINGVVQ
jgi:hypothetical protein